MTRRLLNLLTALSLLLCVAVGALWARSYRPGVILEWWSAGTGGYEFRVFGVYTPAGAIGFYVPDYSAPYPLIYHRYYLEHPRPSVRGVLGFAVNRAGYTPMAGVRWREWRVPMWFLVLVFGVLPLRYMAHAVSARWFDRRGLCVVCGYDLRATPDRCPECGTLAKAPA